MVVERTEGDSIVAVFSTAVNAIRCAKDLQREFRGLKKNNPDDQIRNNSFSIGVGTIKPDSVNEDFFKQAFNFTRRICYTAKDGEIIASFLIGKICNLEDTSALRTLSESEESFINHLVELIESNLYNENLNVNYLSNKLGISRPQLYRKIISLTGQSPHQFISKLKLAKALSLIKLRSGNVSEIAREVGFNSPSYFSKCFKKNYGSTPTEFSKIYHSKGF
jgi:AraC-like DNA-binding protein